MNQHQRKFLLEAIEKQHSTEREKLTEREPRAPSLNNYLTAAVLDGSFKLKTAESIRAAIGERVRDLGKGEALLNSDDYNYRRRRNDNDCEHTVSLPAELLFELPKGYADALAKYSSAYDAWEKEMNALEAAISAMRIKVQIGSDAALAVLVDQADQLCSMSLTAASKLLLANGK